MPTPRPVSRRRLLAWSGASGLAGTAIGVLGNRQVEANPPPANDPEGSRLRLADDATPRNGLPMGLASTVPAFGHVLAVDLAPGVRADPSRARSTAGSFLRHLAALADLEPDADAAAALDLRAASLQVTPGVGASLLDACGLAAQRPEAMVDLPRFVTDRLDPRRCGGDLMVQIGSEDPMKVSGAVQAVASGLGDGLRLRWSRPGFRRTAAAADDPAITVRNLMGHRDGTDNPALGSPLWRSTVLVTEPGWMAGGSYLVARQIRTDLDSWFAHAEHDRDRVIGRHTGTGAALGRRSETQRVDLDLRDAGGGLAVPAHAHIRLASTRDTAGARIYRRSWNYDDGWGPDGREAGLLFLAWQSDVRRGFLPIQTSLVENHDALGAFITHVGSAVFAVPARGSDAYVGQRLLEA